MTPNLFIIGAPKALTTSLHEWLVSHDRVAQASVKELGCLLDPPWAGHKWQPPTLSVPNDCNWLIDSSPWVLYDSDAPARMLGDLADAALGDLAEAKIIVSLRDPAERAKSMYADQTLAGNEKRPIADAIEQELRLEGSVDRSADQYPIRFTAYVQQSQYEPCMQPWFNNLPRERLRIFFPDADQGLQLQAAAVWLGLEPGRSLELPVANQSQGHRPLAPLMRSSRAVLRKSSVAQRLLRTHGGSLRALENRLSYLSFDRSAPARDLPEELDSRLSSCFDFSPQFCRKLAQHSLGPVPDWVERKL